MSTEIIRQTDHDVTAIVEDEGNGFYRFKAIDHKGEEVISEQLEGLSAAAKRLTLFWIDEFNYEGTGVAQRLIDEVVA